MKNEKRRLSCTRAFTAAIIMAIIISLTVPAFAAERYEDVSTGTWYYDAVMFCTKYGMVNGTSATTFSPQGTMTRSQFITVLGRMDGIKDGSDQPVSQYTDVDSAIYYYSHVNWAAANDVSDAKGAEFRPEEKITRDEMIIIIGRYVAYKGVMLADDPEAREVFNDADALSEEASSYIEVLRKSGMFMGNEAGNLTPSYNVTRAEGVTVFQRVYEKFTAAGVELNTEPINVPEETDPAQGPDEPNLDWRSEAYIVAMNEEIARLITEARAEIGLGPVTYRPEYQIGADIRADELLHSFSHDRPDGTGFASIYSEDYSMRRLCGSEAIAKLFCMSGSATPEVAAQTAFDAWMASPGHKGIMMSKRAEGIALGIERENLGYAYFVLHTVVSDW